MLGPESNVRRWLEVEFNYFINVIMVYKHFFYELSEFLSSLLVGAAVPRQVCVSE